MKVLSQLIPITIALSTSGADALGWELAGCTAEKFSDIEVSVECDDSSSCSPGDTAVATGTATATAVFDDEEVTLNACFMGYCPKQAEIGAGTLCDGWLMPTEGQECGAEGEYSVSYEQEIPDQSKIPDKLAKLIAKYVVTIQMSIGDGDDCSSSSGYQLAYGMTGLVSVVLVGAALMKKKKGGDVETDNSFVQMGDRAAIVSGYQTT